MSSADNFLSLDELRDPYINYVIKNSTRDQHNAHMGTHDFILFRKTGIMLKEFIAFLESQQLDPDQISPSVLNRFKNARQISDVQFVHMKVLVDKAMSEQKAVKATEEFNAAEQAPNINFQKA